MISAIKRSVCAHVRQLTLDALEVRGRWPKSQGPVTPIIAVSIKKLQDKAGLWRSTVQRRIQRARRDGYWRKVRDMNSWLNCPKCGAARDSRQCPKCPHKGNGFDAREFRRTFTDVIDVQKFENTPPCRQVREIRELRARHSPKGIAEISVQQAPVKQPAAEHAHSAVYPMMASGLTSSARSWPKRALRAFPSTMRPSRFRNA